MEKTNYSAVDVNGAADTLFRPVGKANGRNATQFTCLMFLKAYQAICCVSSLRKSLWVLIGCIKNRISLENEKTSNGSYLFRLILAFLAMALALLAFEVVAYLNFYIPNAQQNPDISGRFYLFYVEWLEFRANYIAPPLRVLSSFCILFFVIQTADRILLCLGCLWIKFKKIKPIVVENSELYFPMVLVQVPMCNEREVYKQSISAICKLDWPKERLLIQVLDDSDEESIQGLIKGEVSKWDQRGNNIIYRHRSVRTGYKAGNLKSAMSCDYVKDYEFVAIFDADFKPNPDFLKLTIPHFKDNHGLALVQARWVSVNENENLLARLQNVNMCFHFEVEQQVNGVFLNFFGFNGTAGVWRIKALEDSGGWSDRTTVEDMDIAVRAHLRGWKFIFLNDVKVLCELPESYEAYRKQQHRWHCGPIHLFRLCLPSAIKSKITYWKKANLVLLFFLLRKLILPFYSFTLLCIILPLTMFVPEAQLPAWLICYIPVFMSFLSILFDPRSFPYIFANLLFENTMSLIKFDAIISGLFQLGGSYEWVVTKKSGRLSEPDLLAEEETESKQAMSGLSKLSKLKEHQEAAPKPSVKKNKKNMYQREILLAFLLLTAAIRSLLSGQGVLAHFYVLLFQGVAFLIVGLGLIGEK